ncbi:MAG: cell envelope integrity protein CreD [Candidatus Obscuribacterales bacterium]|nr:cell envelope integrity protein CreD [Candidatus Obscuribacterales bacterium]
MNETSDSIAPEPTPKPRKSISKNITIKAGFIALIVALLQIPLLMIKGVIDERQTFNVSYPQQYRGSGCGSQTIIGPVLTIPYRFQITEEKTVPADKTEKDEKTKEKTVTVTKTDIGYLHFFPETLNVNGKLDPQIRDEGRFKSIVYAATLDFKGSFNTNDLQQKKISEKDLVWEDATLALGVSDLRGIRKETTLNWANQKLRFVPGTNGLKLFDAGQSVALKNIDKTGTYPFEFTLNFNGSRDLNIFPAGKENKITLSSTWKDPTFTGGFLPHQKTITQNGFNSEWEVSYFTRNLPQIWTDSDPKIKNSLAQYMVGVTLTTPVEFYRTAIRALKYGSLFIVMTFLTFFIFEMVARIRIHEVQYLLVGLAISLFFLLLIAASEWIPFVWAYVLASIATVVQITWYTQAFSKGISKNLWKVLATTLTALYVYLYILLQLEDFSLLVGAIGLFIAMTIVLYSTRNINWYGEER